MSSSGLESNKIESTLDINSFDKPKELSGIAAWSQLILNLLFLKPGTYPSMPEMGIGIENYQYDFLDDTIAQLQNAITKQQQEYLPDIPLTAVQISKIEQSGQPILIIQLLFTVNGETESSAVAINMSKRNFLTFDVSW